MWNDRAKALVAIALILVLGAIAFRLAGKTSREEAPILPPPVEMARAALELRDGRLVPKTGGGPFTGVMFEQTVDGRRLTEVPVREGRVHGTARGWHDNGKLEVEEPFEDGVSHGVRTRWHPNGNKRNTATILRGVLEGPFSEWHENGQLAARMTLVQGQGEGPCESWLPDGQLKSRVVLKGGKPVTTDPLSNSEPPTASR